MGVLLDDQRWPACGHRVVNRANGGGPYVKLLRPCEIVDDLQIVDEDLRAVVVAVLPENPHEQVADDHKRAINTVLAAAVYEQRRRQGIA